MTELNTEHARRAIVEHTRRLVDMPIYLSTISMTSMAGAAPPWIRLAWIVAGHTYSRRRRSVTANFAVVRLTAFLAPVRA
ncbi:MAG TPA: hypothetical protein VIP77_04620 [Jiangellaceae bacterium]